MRARQVDDSAYLCWVEGANPAAEDMASTLAQRWSAGPREQALWTGLVIAKVGNATLGS